MTVEQVKQVFASKIAGDELFINSNCSVQIDTFAMLFADAEPTYASLVANDNGKGYIPFFDQCKAEGILN